MKFEASAKFLHSLADSSQPYADVGSRLPELDQGFFRDALAEVTDHEAGIVLVRLESHINPVAVGMAMYVRECLLHDAEQRRFNAGRKAAKFLGKPQRGPNAAALAESLHVPGCCRCQAGGIQQWRMKQVRQRTRFLDGAIDELFHFDQITFSLGL